MDYKLQTKEEWMRSRQEDVITAITSSHEANEPISVAWLQELAEINAKLFPSKKTGDNLNKTGEA